MAPARPVHTPGAVLLPGDVVAIPGTSGGASTVRLGPGLAQAGESAIATKAGVLASATGNRIWLNASQKRYIPSLGEPVVAVVLSRHVENYRVDIGGPHPASLPILAFEGATKRNRPQLDVGAVVYARVSLANKDMEPEVECINPSTGRADGFGELAGGFIVRCSLGLSLSLMKKGNPILSKLSQAFPFETAVGANGRVWINAQTPRQIVTVASVFRAADGAAPDRIPAIIKAQLRLLENEDDDQNDMDQD